MGGPGKIEMKPKKLRSPIRAIHEALSSVRLAVGSPLCVQPTKTESFRDLLASFNSVYYTPAVSSSSDFSDSGSQGSLRHHPRQPPVDIRVVSRGGEEDEEEVISVSAATASTSTCSSCLSSSSVTAGADNVLHEAAEDLPKGAINSTRFFFSPCTSKFIAGESFLEVDPAEVGPPGGGLVQEPEVTGDAEEGDWVFDVSPETILEEMATTTETTSAFCRQSIPMALASKDPYRDFRSSMDEMVAAHGLRDWPGLQELLRCYLRLNDRKTHKFIVLAFSDLLVQLVSQGKIHKSVMHETFCTSPLPPSHPPPHHLKPFLSRSTTTHCFPSSSSSSSSCSS